MCRCACISLPAWGMASTRLAFHRLPTSCWTHSSCRCRNKDADMTVEGTCKPGFERVAEAFDKNFSEHGEVGASVCLTVGGETVVDLWGGVADPKTGKAWTRDTVSIVFSCTKGGTALCAHVRASGGQLDIDAPVIELWPEFGQRGKEQVTTRMMLDHSSAVPAVREKVKDSGPYDWSYMTERLAAEEPFWQPGTRNGY